MCYFDGMRKPPIATDCAHCGKTYQMHASRLAKGTGHYCGQQCYLSARWGSNQPCANCGKKSRHRFCSPDCRTTYWNKNSGRVHKSPRHWERKLAIIKALGGKCVTCGFDDFRALDIDHIDRKRKVKKFKTGWTWGRRFADWDANVGNLRLLCANCHRLHTWEQRGFGAPLRLGQG